MKAIWREQTNELYFNSIDYLTTVGKFKISINSKNLQMRAVLGVNMTYIGDKKFKSIEGAKIWLEANFDTLEQIKSMRSLITKF